MPGRIGHWVIKATPSMYGLQCWLIPCQWIVVHSSGIEFFTTISTLSPSQIWIKVSNSFNEVPTSTLRFSQCLNKPCFYINGWTGKLPVYNSHQSSDSISRDAVRSKTVLEYKWTIVTRFTSGQILFYFEVVLACHRRRVGFARTFTRMRLQISSCFTRRNNFVYPMYIIFKKYHIACWSV